MLLFYFHFSAQGGGIGDEGEKRWKEGREKVELGDATFVESATGVAS